MHRLALACCCAMTVFLVAPSSAGQQSTGAATTATTITIRQFSIAGDPSLAQAEADRLLLRWTGAEKHQADIEQARAALERFYQQRGREFVRVAIPEQEISNDTVVLQVSEAKVGKIVVSGNRYFDEANIRASLPALVEGSVPRLAALSAGAQLINENPAKQVRITLGLQGMPGTETSAPRDPGPTQQMPPSPDTQGSQGSQRSQGFQDWQGTSGESVTQGVHPQDSSVALLRTDKPQAANIGADTGEIEALVDVSDSQPQRVFATLDNTGTASSGRYRTGLAYQHANLFNRDHLASLSYITSPDSPAGVKVDLYSLGYRIPLYSLGDSVEFFYGRSSVNTPGTSPTLGGLLGINGKGNVLGLRWNHYLARSGEQSARLVAGFDSRKVDARCFLPDGTALDISPPTPPLASCVPYRTRPLSLAYAARLQRQDDSFDYGFGLAVNLPTGPRYLNVDGRSDRYSYLTPGNRATRDDFRIVRANAAYERALGANWQWRLLANGQFSSDALVSPEQFGLAGSNAVRGMDERAVATDSGLLLNGELTGPQMAGLAGLPGVLRGLVFYDAALGWNRQTVGTQSEARSHVSSAGVGLRYALGRFLSVRLDLARILQAGSSATESNGDWRTQLSVVIGS